MIGLPPEQASNSLARFLQVIREQFWKILAFMIIAMVATVIVSKLLDQLFESTVIIKVDRHSVAGVVGQEASQTLPVNDMDQIITTQMELIQSDPVLRPVVEKYHLLELENQFSGLKADEAARLRQAPVVLKRLKVMRPPNTYLIKVTYRANGPKLAADITNDIAKSYLARLNEAHSHSTSEVSVLITKQLQDLRARMDASSAALAQYERELNLVDPEQRTSILSARLLQLNTEFTNIQAERVRKEAIMKSLDSPTLAAAQASTTGESLERAIERLDEAKQNFAKTRSTYGENHAEYRKSRDQVAELERQLDQLRTNTKARAQAEYFQASTREQQIARVLNQTKAEFDQLSSRSLQYQQLKRDAENDKKLYEDLYRRTKEADINNGFQDETIQIAAPAVPAAKHVFPNTLLLVALAFVLSGILGVGGALLSDALDTTLSDPEEAATRLKVDVLGGIPMAKNLPSAATLARQIEDPLEQPGKKRSALTVARYGEAIRSLRNAVGIANLDRPVRTVLMTSAHPSEGKSTTAAHLAVAFAQIGKRILLIDADLRRPSIHKQFGLTGASGLSDVLTGAMDWREAMLRIDPHGLYVMPAGPVSRRASDLIGPGITELLDKVGREFDLVIVDAPPLLGFAESQQLAGVVDSVILVAKAGETRGKAVANSLTALLRARANILGLVMNAVKVTKHSDYGYYLNYTNYARE
jgi:capsular exopolysaccharide synthesis family protein